jgi:hypothetical protein
VKIKLALKKIRNERKDSEIRLKKKKKSIKAKSGEKKIRMRKEKNVENISKHLSFYTKSEIKSAYFFDIHIILLMYKEIYFNTDNFDSLIFLEELNNNGFYK